MTVPDILTDQTCTIYWSIGKSKKTNGELELNFPLMTILRALRYEIAKSS